MDHASLVPPDSIDCIETGPPFSSFRYLENGYGDPASIHRCFSLARSMGFKTLIVEDIPAAGAIRAENEEIARLAKDYSMKALRRLSFWMSAIPEPGALDDARSEDLIGFAILKHDICASRSIDRWHVFEAVFRKYPHEHNCVPKPNTHRVRIGSGEFTVEGVLYCQQNRLNKACAHVALRSLLSRRRRTQNITFSEMNAIAAGVLPGPFDPANGLSVPQMRAILDAYKIPYRDVDYDEKEKLDPDIRLTHPFQKYIYAGVESGSGGLLGFRLSGPKAPDERHIIPFYGHTFNKDTWVPDADFAYFNVGGGIGYVPSLNWTSSFLGHDDNFGANYCVPRLYANPGLVDYVVELMPDGYKYDGVAAEAIGLQFLYSLHPKLARYRGNPWMRRLFSVSRPDVQRVVLRAIAASRAEYVAALQEMRDWDGRAEDDKILDILKEHLPKSLWICEISSPQLFPANERKIGEIVMDASVEGSAQDSMNFDKFFICRLPGRYFYLESTPEGRTEFADVPSNLKSHTPLFKYQKTA